MHPSVAKYCIDEKTKIYTDEFENLDEAVSEHVLEYRPSHIALALDKGLTVEQTVAFIAEQRALEAQQDAAEIAQAA